MSESNGLPKGWSGCDLGGILTIVRGVSYDKTQASKADSDGMVPILRATNIDQTLDFDDLVYVQQSCVSQDQYLQTGDIVIAASSGSRNVVGKAAQFKGEWIGAFGAFCMGLRVAKEINSSYVAWFLQSQEYRQRISNLAAGSNINNLRREHIESFPFRLAPLNEQCRIVGKIEELFSDLDAGVAALERIKANLENYSTAVVKAAVEGRLTEDWRAKHPRMEPAVKLLERILSERRRRWEEDQLTKFAAADKPPSKGWREKYVVPDGPDTTKLPELPPGWCWATFEQCAAEITVGHVGPMKDRYVSAGVPFLRSQNVRPLKYEIEGLEFIPTDFHAQLGKSRLCGGELLVVRSGVNVGDSCVYPEAGPEANCADLVITRPLPGLLSKYGAIYVVSPSGKAALHLRRTGNAQPHFNIGAMRQQAFPLPPLEEQHEIVQEVERRLSLAKDAASQVNANLKRAARLRQSILKRAFEGKLVPQDPNDEPADKLLERIRQERAADKMQEGRNGSTRRTIGTTKASIKK